MDDAGRGPWDDVPRGLGLVLDDGRGSLPFALIHGEALVACAAWAVGEARVDLVDATWKLPLERIVIASWLRELAQEKFGVHAHGPVPNGVDLEIFHPRGRHDSDRPTVGMLYELQAWKGFEEGLVDFYTLRDDRLVLLCWQLGEEEITHWHEVGAGFAGAAFATAKMLSPRRSWNLATTPHESDERRTPAPIRTRGPANRGSRAER